MNGAINSCPPLSRLATILEKTGAADDVLVISFNHRDLLDLKTRLPHARTESIVHKRLVNPVQALEAARVSSTSIELNMFHPDDARTLHGAGIAIRLHLPRPDTLERYARLGVDAVPQIRVWHETGLVDSLSGDDVGFLAGLVGQRAPAKT